MKKKRFEIFPIVESEILPDNTLELIKGGGNMIMCDERFGCSEVDLLHGCKVVTCGGYCFVCVGFDRVCDADGGGITTTGF